MFEIKKQQRRLVSDQPCTEHFIELEGEDIHMKERVCLGMHYRDFSLASFNLRFH